MAHNVFTAGAVLAWCLASLACGGSDTPRTVTEKTQPAAPVSERPKPIETYIVTASSANSSLTRPATLAYAEDEFSTISSPLQGRVLEVRKRLGEAVKAGEILMVIDSPDIATAYSDFVKEISELGMAERNYDLIKSLYEVQAVSLKEFKQAENDLIRERAEFAQAKDKLVFLGVPAGELKKTTPTPVITSRFELKSPLTGTVVERNVTPGQLVGPDTTAPLMTVANLNRLQVVADVYERDVPLIHIGQRGHLQVEAYPNLDIEANIVFIGEVVEPNTRTIKIRARIDNADHRLKPQMYGKLQIPVESTAQIILIPRKALAHANGRTVVYVEQSPGLFQPRPISIQEEPGDRVRVLEGLAVGERIASQDLNAGQSS